MNCATLGCPTPTGTRMSHCCGCHRTFSSVTAFDRHQTLDNGNVCHDPETKGLVLRADGVWRCPGDGLSHLRGGTSAA